MPNRPTALTGRRRELAEAAVVVVARSGLRGLTHRAVDAQAGVPEGTTSAYLRTKAALLSAMTTLVSEELVGDVGALAARLAATPDGHEHGVEATVEVLVGWLERPELMRARAELDLEALRQPAVYDELLPARRTMLDAVAVMVAEHGCSEPALRAQAIVAALDGILGAVLFLSPDQRVSYVRETAGITLAALLDSDVVPPPS